MATKKFYTSRRFVAATPRSSRLRNSGLGASAGTSATPGQLSGYTDKDTGDDVKFVHMKWAETDTPQTSDELMDIPGPYVGVYIDSYINDSTDPARYTWTRFTGYNGKDGEPGPRGEQGEPGAPGADGKDGRDGLMSYVAGEYDPETLYEATDDTVPIVLYRGEYYVLKRGRSYRGVEQAEDAQTPPDDIDQNCDTHSWTLLEHFAAVFADIIIAEFGHLGKAVFTGDWMISAEGVKRTKTVWRYAATAKPFTDATAASLYGETWPDDVIYGGKCYAIKAEAYMDGTVTSPWTGPHTVYGLQESEITEVSGSTDYQLWKHGSFEPAYKLNLCTGEIGATHGTFAGSLRTSFKPILNSDARVLGTGDNRQYFVMNDLNLATQGQEVVLPVALSMVGTRVVLCDTQLSASATDGTRVITQDGGYIGGIAPGATSRAAGTPSGGEELPYECKPVDFGVVPPSDRVGVTYDPWVANPAGSRQVQFINGVVELVCAPCTQTANGVTYNIARWFLLSAMCSSITGKN